MTTSSLFTAQSARVLVPAALAFAAAAIVAPVAGRAQAAAAPQHVVLAAADDGLPGEGRPPSPGPTDPDGASAR